VEEERSTELGCLARENEEEGEAREERARGLLFNLNF
jgi:hypothetical protein